METDMVGYYARRATEYERIYAKPERQEDIGELRRRLPVVFRGQEVLEISCGTGYWTEVIAPAAKSVVATDVNEAVLAIARAKDWNGMPVAFLAADSYALPRFDRGFSAGFSGFWWSHIPKGKLASFFRGFHASLAKGAQVAFVDNRFVQGSSTPVCRTDADGNTYQNRALDDGSVHEVLKNFPSRAEIESVVSGIGDSIEVQVLGYFWLLTYRVK